jgi:hypothetical protein
VSSAFLQRAVLLAAVTLLGGVIALALADRLRDSGSSENLPEAVVPPGGGWYEALAGLESRRVYGRPTACGHVIEPSTMGFAHPVLPCGAKIYLGHADKEVLTQVVGHGPTPGGVQFGLTEALARELGIDGRATIRWRFARRA